MLCSASPASGGGSSRTASVGAGVGDPGPSRRSRTSPPDRRKSAPPTTSNATSDTTSRRSRCRRPSPASHRPIPTSRKTIPPRDGENAPSPTRHTVMAPAASAPASQRPSRSTTPSTPSARRLPTKRKLAVWLRFGKKTERRPRAEGIMPAGFPRVDGHGPINPRGHGGRQRQHAQRVRAHRVRQQEEAEQQGYRQHREPKNGQRGRNADRARQHDGGQPVQGLPPGGRPDRVFGQERERRAGQHAHRRQPQPPFHLHPRGTGDQRRARAQQENSHRALLRPSSEENGRRRAAEQQSVDHRPERTHRQREAGRPAGIGRRLGGGGGFHGRRGSRMPGTKQVPPRRATSGRFCRAGGLACRVLTLRLKSASVLLSPAICAPSRGRRSRPPYTSPTETPGRCPSASWRA